MSFMGLPNLFEEDFEKVSIDPRDLALVPEYDLSQLVERVQIRDLPPGDKAPPERVREYADRMKTEQVPPILVTRDGELGDGNTRKQAALKNKRAFLPAVVLPIDYRTGSARDRAKVDALAARANRHGESLTKAEKRKVVRELVQDNWTGEMIGLFVGVTKSTVTEIKDEIAAEDKFHKLGISGNGSVLKGASLRALGKQASMNDQPFQALSALAADAGLNAAEIRTLATQAKDAGSDGDALAVIAAERSQRAGQIEERRLTGSGKPPTARLLRQHLGFIKNYKGKEEALVEKGEAYREAHYEALKMAVDVLSRACELQFAERP